MPGSNPAASAAYRARQRGDKPPLPTCCACGKRCSGSHQLLQEPICSRCFLPAEAGRQWQRERLAKWRAERKRKRNDM